MPGGCHEGSWCREWRLRQSLKSRPRFPLPPHNPHRVPIWHWVCWGKAQGRRSGSPPCRHIVRRAVRSPANRRCFWHFLSVRIRRRCPAGRTTMLREKPHQCAGRRWPPHFHGRHASGIPPDCPSVRVRFPLPVHRAVLRLKSWSPPRF